MKRNIYTPKTGWYVIDDAELPATENKSPYIGGVSMTDRSIKDARHVFTKRDRMMGRNRTVKDMDRALDSFQVRYPHLKRPDRMRRDPFPNINIKDDYRNKAE